MGAVTARRTGRHGHAARGGVMEVREMGWFAQLRWPGFEVRVAVYRKDHLEPADLDVAIRFLEMVRAGLIEDARPLPDPPSTEGQ